MYSINEVFKTVNCSNPVSGHKWTENGKSIGFEVRGGLWITTRHKTKELAEKELDLRIGIDKLIKNLDDMKTLGDKFIEDIK